MKLPEHVYHMAESVNWRSIQRHGLLPTSQLLELARIPADECAQLERTQRQVHTELPNGVQIRDQRPMPPSALHACLVGMIPADWYALINSRVFFWLDPDRLNRQRAACSMRSQVVLTVDTTRLLASYRERVALSPINTGNARRRPALRGAASFVPYTIWVKQGWASEASALRTKERKRSQPPAELTVVGPILDAMRFVTCVSELPPGEQFKPE